MAEGEKDLTHLFLHHAMDRVSYLEGVRITRGPLMDLEGVLVRSNPQQGHVDGTRVEAA